MLILAFTACSSPTTQSTGKLDSGTRDTSSGGGSGSGSAETVDTALPAADSADTGLPACGPEIVLVPTAICAETTAVVRQDWIYADVAASATVTEIGGVLAPVSGSAPIGGFPACGAAHLHQVRLVDGLGATWTVGWDVEGAVDDASTDAIALQAPLELHVVSGGSEYGLDLGLGLGDGAPLVFLESLGYLAPALDDADRGGIEVGITWQGGCLRDVVPWGGWDWDGPGHFSPVTFLGPSGAVAIESGATAAIDLGSRQLELALTESVRLVGCADACARTTWAAWATP